MPSDDAPASRRRHRARSALSSATMLACVVLLCASATARMALGASLEAATAVMRSAQQIDAKILSMRLTKDDRIMFAADVDKGMSVYDVTDGTKPLLVTTIPTSGAPKDCFLNSDDSTLFVADGAAGLTIVDVENPRFPVIGATLALGGAATHVRVDNTSTTAFVAVKNVGVKVVNITDKTAPTLLSTIAIATAAGVQQDVIMLEVSANGDVIAALTEIGGTQLGASNVGTAGKGTDVFFIYSRSSAASYTYTKRYEEANKYVAATPSNGGYIKGMAMFRDGASMLVGRHHGVYLMDLSNPASPTMTCAYTNPWTGGGAPGPSAQPGCALTTTVLTDSDATRESVRTMSLSADETRLFAVHVADPGTATPPALPVLDNSQSGIVVAALSFFKVKADRTLTVLGSDTTLDPATSLSTALNTVYLKDGTAALPIPFVTGSSDGKVMFATDPDEGYVAIKGLSASGSVSMQGTDILTMSTTPYNSYFYDRSGASLSAARYDREQFAASRDGKFLYHVGPTNGATTTTLQVVDMPDGASGAVTTRTYTLDTDLTLAQSPYLCKDPNNANAVCESGGAGLGVGAATCACSLTGTRYQTSRFSGGAGNDDSQLPQFLDEENTGNFLGYNIRVTGTNLVIIYHDATFTYKNVYALSKFKSTANGGVNPAAGTVVKDVQYKFHDEISIVHGRYVQDSSEDEKIWVGVRSTTKFKDASTAYPNVRDRIAGATQYGANDVIIMDFTASTTSPVVSNYTLGANAGATSWQNEFLGITNLILSADGKAVYARSRYMTQSDTDLGTGYLYTLDASDKSAITVDAEGVLTSDLSPRSIVASPDRTRLYAVESFDRTVTVVDISNGASPSILSRYNTYCSMIQPDVKGDGKQNAPPHLYGPIDSLHVNNDGTRVEVLCRDRKGFEFDGQNTATNFRFDGLPQTWTLIQFSEILDVTDPTGTVTPLTIISDPASTTVDSTVTYGRGWNQWIIFPLRDADGKDVFVAEKSNGLGLAYYPVVAALVDMFNGPTRANGEFYRKVHYVATLASAPSDTTLALLPSGYGGAAITTTFDPSEAGNSGIRQDGVRLAGSAALLSTRGFTVVQAFLGGGGTSLVLQSSAVNPEFAGKQVTLIVPIKVLDSGGSTVLSTWYVVIEFAVRATVRGVTYDNSALAMSTPEAMLSVTLTLPNTNDNVTFVTSDTLSAQTSFSGSNRVAQMFGIQSSVNAAMKELRYHSLNNKTIVEGLSVGCRVTDLISPELSLTVVGVPSLKLSNFKYNEHPRLLSSVNDLTHVFGQVFEEKMNVTTWFADADDAKLTFTVTRRDGLAMPSWLTFNTETNPPTLSGSSLSAASATKTFNSATFTYEETIPLRLAASDGYTSALAEFDLLMKNKAPYVTSCTLVAGVCHAGHLSRVLGKSFVHYVNSSLFTDDDKPSSQLSSYEVVQLDAAGNVVALPAWLTFNPQTLALSGSTESSIGLAPSDYSVASARYEKQFKLKITAKEADTVNFPLSASSLTLDLVMLNHAPTSNSTGSYTVISGSEASIDVRQFFYDADLLDMTFRISDTAGGVAPGFMRLDPTGKFLLVAPSATNEGKTTVVVHASDGVNKEVSSTVNIKVKLTDLEAAQYWLLTIVSALSGLSTLATLYGFLWMIKNYHTSSRHWRVTAPMVRTTEEAKRLVEGHRFYSGKKARREISDISDVDSLQMFQILAPASYMRVLPDHLRKYMSAHPLFDGRSVPTWLELNKKTCRLQFKEQHFHPELESGLHYVLVAKRNDKSTVDTLDLNFTLLSADGVSTVMSDAVVNQALAAAKLATQAQRK